ncbi:MAG: hypothetical protein ACI4QG_03980, partial [Candidatus Cryptobacteroides sp.]
GRIYNYIIETNVVEGLEDPVVVSNKVEIGRLPVGVDAAGIRAVAATVKHERRHQEMHQVFFGSQDTGDIPVFFDVDNDSDEVFDADEVAGRWGVVTDPNCPDTFDMWRISSQYESYGDNEVRARIAEEEGIQGAYSIENDWCNPGCQSEVCRGPMTDESRK